jgi:hypothetical protein
MTGLRGTDRTALTPPSNSEQVRAYGPGSNKVAPNAKPQQQPDLTVCGVPLPQVLQRHPQPVHEPVRRLHVGEQDGRIGGARGRGVRQTGHDVGGPAAQPAARLRVGVAGVRPQRRTGRVGDRGDLARGGRMHQPHRTAAVAVRQLPRQPEHVGEHRRIARRGGRFWPLGTALMLQARAPGHAADHCPAACDGGVLSLADRVTQHFSEHLHGGGRAVVELVLTDLHQRRQVECLDVTADRRRRGDPRVVEAEHRYLTHDQVRQLADLRGRYRLVVLFLAYTGARFGEMAALRVGRLDFLRRRAVIAESVTEVSGAQVWGTPKGRGVRCRCRGSCSTSGPCMPPARTVTRPYSLPPRVFNPGYRLGQASPRKCLACSGGRG